MARRGAGPSFAAMGSPRVLPCGAAALDLGDVPVCADSHCAAQFSVETADHRLRGIAGHSPPAADAGALPETRPVQAMFGAAEVGLAPR